MEKKSDKKTKERPQSSKLMCKDVNFDMNRPKTATNKRATPYKQENNIKNDLLSPLPETKKNGQSIFVDQELNQESLDEEYEIIQKIWENLGITIKYKIQFDNYIQSVTEKEIRNIFINEKNNLKKYGEALLKLNKEIKTRENNIQSLKKYTFSLSNNSNYFDDEENEKIKQNRENIIMNIISLIKSLRLNSINVVNQFVKLRKIITFYNLVGKINMKSINRDYIYDENYLLKMQKDMLFLKNYPGLQKYFDMNNSEIDAFLTNFSPNQNMNYSRINNNKAKVFVSDELQNAINQCRYVLIQENFFLKMKNGTNIEQLVLNNTKNNSKEILCDAPLYKSYSLKIKNPSSKIQFFHDNSDNRKDNFYVNYKKLTQNPLFRNLESFRRIKGSNDYNKLFFMEKYQRVMSNNNFNFMKKLDNEDNFLSKRFKANNNPIIIEREERGDISKISFKLQNKLCNKKEDPLLEENEELKKQIDELNEENDKLKEEVKKIKKYVVTIKEKQKEEEKQREIIGNKKYKEFKEKELENELKYKELVKKIGELKKEKEVLNNKITDLDKLMEKRAEEHQQKINEMEDLRQKEKEEYEQKIDNCKEEIKQLNEQKDSIIIEKNGIIQERDNLINEKDNLILEKKGLEEKNEQMKNQIEEYEKEMEKYKKLQEDFKNLEIHSKELEHDIEELKLKIESENSEKEKVVNELTNQINELNNNIDTINQNNSNLKEDIKNKQIENDILTRDKEDLINQKNELKREIQNLTSIIKDLKLNNQISNVPKKIKASIKSEDSKMIIGKYNYDFYRGNLSNLIKKLSENLFFDKIPDFLKISLNLKDSKILKEKKYLKGIYPKLIISTKDEIITGFCLVYYDNYGEQGQPLVLKIETMCVQEEDCYTSISACLTSPAGQALSAVCR